jgi:hypothetical protein
LLLAGLGVAAWAPGPRNGFERFGLAACLGPGIVGLILIAISMLGLAPSRVEILCISLVLIFSGAARLRKFSWRNLRLPALRLDARTGWTILCLVSIIYGLFVAATSALTGPTLEWDAFAIWQLKAKVLAIHALVPVPDYFRSVGLSYSHLLYPILAPMISAGAHAMTGQINDDLGRSPYLLMYAGMGALIYGYVRTQRGHIPAISCTALLMTLPALLQFAGSGTAEMALTAFFAASVVCILRWQQNRRLGDLALAAFFSICMGWTKNEGLALGAINALVVLFLTPLPLVRRNLAAAAAFAAIFVAACVPWLIYVHGLPHTDEDYIHRLRPSQIAAGGRYLPLVLKSLFAEFVNWSDWEIFWLFPVALAIYQFRVRPTRMIVTLWVLIALQLLAYIPPYLVTPWDLGVLLPMTLSRLLLHLAPAAALLIGLQWPRSSI